MEYHLDLPDEVTHLAAAQGHIQAALTAAAEGRTWESHAKAAEAALRPRKAIEAAGTLSLIGEDSPLFSDLVEAHAAKRENRLVGVPTGVDALDRVLGGYRPGLTLVGAIPGGGKTALALRAAEAAARGGRRVLFVTADEAPERLALKLACMVADLPVGQFIDGYRHPAELVEAISKDVEPWLDRVEFIPAFGLSLHGLDLRGYGLAIVDYIQAVAAGVGVAAEMRHMIDSVAATLRGLALEARVPVLCLSSLNRAGYGDPGMAALRESGGLEFCADVVMLLQCEDPKAPLRDLVVKIQKNRHGPAFIEEPLVFDPKIMAFTSPAMKAAPLADAYQRARFKR